MHTRHRDATQSGADAGGGYRGDGGSEEIRFWAMARGEFLREAAGDPRLGELCDARLT